MSANRPILLLAIACVSLTAVYGQRLSLAQASLHAPALLVVDEPTSGLDPRQRQAIRAVLAKLSGECTLLLCTHDLHEAEALTTRVAVLRSGRLIAEGATTEVLGSGDC